MSRKNLVAPDVGCPPLLIRQVRIPTASVLTLNATPFLLVPGPGGLTQATYTTAIAAGPMQKQTKALFFEKAIVNVVKGSGAGTAYDNGGDGLRVQYQGGGTAVSFVFTDPLNAATAGTIFVLNRCGTDLSTEAAPASLTPNKGLELTNVTAEVTTGTHDLIVTTFYRIIELKGT
jgi:hypothetical protein